MEDEGNKSLSQVQLSETQENILSDIFGADSDDDDEVVAPGQRAAPKVFYGEYDSIDDSDEDSGPKKSKVLKIANKKTSRHDDDYDEDISNSKTKKLDKKKKRKHDEKSKEKSRGGEERSKKRSKTEKEAKFNKSGNKGEGDGESSGDEYDSGDEVHRTAEDDAFLDEDDALRGITKEYDEDNQVFDDERPESSHKKVKARSSGAASGAGGVGSKAFKDLDPLSQTLAMIKRPKVVEMADNDKARIVTDLLRKMDIACRLDEELYRQKQPAIHKLQLLKTVENIVGIKALQQTLLEYDILAALKDWIEPKDVKTLPSLEVRTAVYHMLLLLPCQVDHLKRAAPGKQPIGMTIVALRKHKMETESNKRILKEIMEKWSRPVFGKSVDARNSSARDNTELRELAMQRMLSAAAKSAAVSPRASIDGANANGTSDGSHLDAALSGGDAAAAKPEGFARNRASCPQSSGFLFTVSPEFVSKTVPDKTAESQIGETREKLHRIMRENKAPPATLRGPGVGKKQNIKAVSMALTGRNKA